ncbi:unannotated protein [freshwater metagenome]|uniref:Unannotated protein n=1 Tax=freshwater metagenome TaxID=449393 RepID=A0A6J7JZX5_9ZZZZ|nr:hypothetical protein [Actinomycetota bacterium]
MRNDYPALDRSKVYVFDPVGIDLEEALWTDNTFFAAPGDHVLIQRHREGSHAVLLMRPDGMPCGSALYRSVREATEEERRNLSS